MAARTPWHGASNDPEFSAQADRWFRDTPKWVLGELVEEFAARCDPDSFDESMATGRWLTGVIETQHLLVANRKRREAEMIVRLQREWPAGLRVEWGEPGTQRRTGTSMGKAAREGWIEIMADEKSWKSGVHTYTHTAGKSLVHHKRLEVAAEAR